MEILTVKECANFLKMSERTVRTLIAKKDFCPVRRIGKSVRIIKDDLFDWLNNRNDKVDEYKRKKNQKFINNIDNFLK